jgi:hypothetical protein
VTAKCNNEANDDSPPGRPETRTLVSQQEQSERDEREPWEEPSGWRDKLPGYGHLAGPIRDKLIYRLLVSNGKTRRFWDNTAVVKVPQSKRRHYIEKSLVIHALSVGWDQGAEQWQDLRQCLTLVRAWRRFHGYSDDPDYAIILGFAFRYTAEVRAAYAARKRLQWEERQRSKTYYRIACWLRDLGRSAAIGEIAQGLSLTEGSVRAQLTRMVQQTQKELESKQDLDEWAWERPPIFRVQRGIYLFGNPESTQAEVPPEEPKSQKPDSPTVEEPYSDLFDEWLPD